MACLGPLTAYLPKSDANDKRLVFKKNDSHSGIPVQVPCGKCIECKLEHSRQWAVRCMHEKRMHTDAAFLTLTYDNDHLPSGGTLVKRDLQLFMKRLRTMHTGSGLRFFACGEYGEKSKRPHYHVLMLSHSFNDLRPAARVFQSRSRSDKYTLYQSKTLSKLWTAGSSLVGDVTFDSCAYVARYCTKKITGPIAAAHYNGRLPEFLVMSLRPGIGMTYLLKYHSELIAHDTVIVNGHQTSLPRYYDVKLTDNLDQNMVNFGCSSRMDMLKISRRRKIDRTDNSSRRRRAKEIVTLAKLLNKARTI